MNGLKRLLYTLLFGPVCVIWLVGTLITGVIFSPISWLLVGYRKDGRAWTDFYGEPIDVIWHPMERLLK